MSILFIYFCSTEQLAEQPALSVCITICRAVSAGAPGGVREAPALGRGKARLRTAAVRQGHRLRGIGQLQASVYIPIVQFSLSGKPITN